MERTYSGELYGWVTIEGVKRCELVCLSYVKSMCMHVHFICSWLYSLASYTAIQLSISHAWFKVHKLADHDNYVALLLYPMSLCTCREVDCYDTCIQGNPIFPSIPLSCCGDPILLSETISTTIGPNYLIARLYSPNEEGMDVYRHNTFCKYVCQHILQLHVWYSRS